MDPVLARPPTGYPAGFGEPGGVAQEFRCSCSSEVINATPRSGLGFAIPGGAFSWPQCVQHITPPTTSPASPYHTCWCGNHSGTSCVCRSRCAFRLLSAIPQIKYSAMPPPMKATTTHPILPANSPHCAGELSVPDVHPSTVACCCGAVVQIVQACFCAACSL